MNDELSRRIKRIYAAIDETVTLNPQEFRPTVRQRDEGDYEAVVSFRGDATDEQLENDVNNAIHAVAHFKDHLKRWAREKGKDSAAVERTINGSRDLQVVIDLSNRDKHGPPRGNEIGRSGLRPSLVNFSRGLTLQAEGKGRRKEGSVVITMFGEVEGVDFDGTWVETSADIIDASGTKVGDAASVARAGVRAWEALLAEYGARLT